ncbi:MAG: hypothetical protein H7Z15_14805 [Rhizobacter sp.]|nr:hypothetical protein [Rhizobacter sp.]
MVKTTVVRKGEVVAAAFGAGQQVAVATVANIDADGTPWIQLNGMPDPVLARVVGEVSASKGDDVAVVFEGGDRTRPIILGAVLARLATPPAAATSAAAGPEQELVVNGKTLRLQAETELSLNCGNASILLRRDGKLIIKGTEVVSRASGTHKIRGGLVNIN